MKKTILISGANGQLGSFLATAYHNEGNRLILLYHKRTDRITHLLDSALHSSFSLDLNDFNDLETCRQENDLQPDIVVHCAALRSSDALPLCETSVGFFQQVFNSNFYSCYNLLRVFLPVMQENGFGRVIILGSSVSRSGLKNGSAYSAAKAACANLVKSTAQEMAKCNVLINTISPAPLDTELEEEYSGDYLEFRKAYFADHLRRVPSGKLVSKAELKKVIDLLSDETLQNLTGQEIFLEGGL